MPRGSHKIEISGRRWTGVGEEERSSWCCFLGEVGREVLGEGMVGTGMGAEGVDFCGDVERFVWLGEDGEEGLGVDEEGLAGVLEEDGWGVELFRLLEEVCFVCLAEKEGEEELEMDCCLGGERERW